VPALLVHLLLWSVVTIGLFWAARRVHGRWPRRWLMPVAVTPVLVGLVIVALQADYAEYLEGTRWLLWMQGPATVAFAVPIYEQRALIRQHWRVLLAGMAVGSLVALGTSWALASVLGLDDTLRRSLLPRSLSTPFAVSVSHDIGGVPGLTALFVILTGVLGAVIGDLLLTRLQGGSALARGALFGMGAHAIGTARANQVGRTEGAVAGLVMVLVGLLHVLAAPLFVHLLGTHAA
jgi:predicted murein hydrolase (TIGR00659 family)